MDLPTYPDVVFAQASPRSIGGVSLFDAPLPVGADVAAYYSTDDDVREAVVRLREAGFTVLDDRSPVTINFAGPPELFEQVFHTRLETEEREVVKGGAHPGTSTFLDCPDTEQRGFVDPSESPLANILEGVALEEPRVLMGAPSPHPPTPPYWHLDVPAGVADGLNATAAHRQGFTGAGQHVVMVDTGHFTNHPYFQTIGYQIEPTVLGPATSDPDHDANGHGTAESANALAIAPECRFTMVKMHHVNTTGAFNQAVSLAPNVISCSWGSDVPGSVLSAADQVLGAAVASAVATGIVVLFAAGNGHYGFPGQHPDVISVGGVHLRADRNLEASDYASGFVSRVFPHRRSPDVCGLVGMQPRAAYIMLPLEPGCTIDQDLGNALPWPDGDETAPDDGWACISGTSAAAPQVAGACALILQKASHTPAEVRQILEDTARDVTTGTCHQGASATVGVDEATGHGLVDVEAAVALA